MAISIILTLATLLFYSHVIVAQQIIVTEWWQHAVIYQIYPRTFMDSNNNGDGDLQGIIARMDHITDINVDAIWLSPIYTSPQVDGGYDISDYEEIDQIYGTLEDFDALVAKCNELGIKLIMDLVPNHSSDKHEWFTKSQAEDPDYDEYYIWKDPKTDGGPPNNWISVFGGSAWTLDSNRNQYYLHQFTKEQPDLNFRSEKVQQEFLDIITFWLDRGVHGFRIDAIRHLFEDIAFEDEPLANNGAAENTHDYLLHTFTTDQAETYDIIYKWREHLDQYVTEKGGERRILMTEAYADIKEVMKYYISDDIEVKVGAQFPFNFNLVGGLNSDADARDIVALVHNWLDYMPAGFIPNWVLGNHDNHRVATRVGTSQVNCINMLSAILPGVMVTYNGEEIGMENGEVTFDQKRDPSATDPETFDEVSRDFERTPFHWDSTTNAGFNEGYEPWLPVSEKYLSNNLIGQKADDNSHYNIYKALTQFRKNSVTLQQGTLDIHAVSKNVILALRKYPEEKTVLFACHMGKGTSAKVSINLADYGFVPDSNRYTVIAYSSEETAVASTSEKTLSDNILELSPTDALVLESTSSASQKQLTVLLMLAALLNYYFM